MLREGSERRQIHDPTWLDWIKMAVVREHLFVYTFIITHLNLMPCVTAFSSMINFHSVLILPQSCMLTLTVKSLFVMLVR